jgi:hypothetical protein
MSLDVVANQYLAVLSVIELGTGHDTPGTDVLRHSSFQGKSIYPHRGERNQFDKHQHWNISEWKGVTDGAYTFLDDTDLLLDTRDMLIGSGHIELNFESVPQQGKLSIH